jgi:hypothetical protein
MIVHIFTDNTATKLLYAAQVAHMTNRGHSAQISPTPGAQSSHVQSPEPPAVTDHCSLSTGRDTPPPPIPPRGINFP